jgi:hypothetical protein
MRGYEFLRYVNAGTAENIEWKITFSDDKHQQLYYTGEISPRGVAGYVIHNEIVQRPPYEEGLPQSKCQASV